MSGVMFEAVVAATGLSPRLAPFVVRRVCATAGFPSTSLDGTNAHLILPELEEALRLYLEGDAASDAIARVHAVVGVEPSGRRVG